MNRYPATLLAVALLVGCSTVPGTNRSRFNIVPMDTQIALGIDAYSQMTDSAPVLTQGADYEMVQRVGRRIAESANALYPEPSLQFDWEFRLIDEPDTLNAWALPGGKCAVYTGLLKATQNEDALAAVMGHEAAHAIAEHGGERMSQSVLLESALAGASIALGDMSPAARSATMEALGVASQTGVMLPFSRKHESEADKLGLYIAAGAGYDPRAAVGLWERMAEMGGDRPPEFLSTHPSEETRIRKLELEMPNAVELYETRKKKMGRR